MGLARAWGFVGISNDDAARALLAWDFSRAPRLDATHSSWLPAHTWLVGTLVALTRSLAHAPHAVSFVATVACVALAVMAAVHRGASRGAAWGAALLALAWRWSVWCGAAGAVPEMPAAALLLGAVVAADRGRFALAGLLATLGCGHRYEAWFATAGLALAVARETRDRRALRFVALAAVMPLGWLAMNALRAGDPWDFVRRVEAFRAREGVEAPGALRFLFTLGRELPHLAVLAVVGALGVGAARGLDAPTVAALAVLAGLVVGDGRGGGPTHHAARGLVVVAWLLAPSVARGLDASRLRREAYALVLAGALWAAPRPSALGSLAARDAAAAGDALRGERGPYLLEAARQDHLWVMVRSGRPGDAVRDRAWGEAEPGVQSRVRWVHRARSAAISSDAVQELLRAKGFVGITGAAGWRVMVR